MHNLALIPVAFTLTVLNDGDEVALTHEEFARSQTKPSFPSNPREFEVSPEEGVVASNDSMRIKVPIFPLLPFPFTIFRIMACYSKNYTIADLHGQYRAHRSHDDSSRHVGLRLAPRPVADHIQRQSVPIDDRSPGHHGPILLPQLSVFQNHRRDQQFGHRRILLFHTATSNYFIYIYI